MELNKKNINRFCYVCGFDMNKDSDFIIKFGTTCPCCNFEYGIEDTAIGNNAIMIYRKKWINNGFTFGIKDSTLTLDELFKQLANLKLISIDDYFNKKTANENSNWTSEIDLNEITTAFNKTKK